MSNPTLRSVWVVDNLIANINGREAGNTVTVDGGEPIPIRGVLPVFDKASEAHRFNEGTAVKSTVREVTLVIHDGEAADG